MSRADITTSALHLHRTTLAGVWRKKQRFTGPVSARQTEVNTERLTGQPPCTYSVSSRFTETPCLRNQVGRGAGQYGACF